MLKMRSVLCILISALLLFGGAACGEEIVVAVPDYPDMSPYPMMGEDASPFPEDDAYDAWRQDVVAQRRNTGYEEGLAPYLASVSQTFLTGGDGENRVLSPPSLYMALAMLAETTQGETRAQILALLGSENIEALRAQTNDLWNANYRSDGAMTRILSTSLWLDDSVAFNADTVNRLAETYYASTYRGDMGSTDMNAALQDWLNQNTNGLLQEEAASVRFAPDTLAALASALSFSAKWDASFSETRNTEAVFHAPGGDVTATFMNATKRDLLYWGAHFQAVSVPFEQGGAMWFILPDEGYTPDDLLADAECLRFLFEERNSASSRQLEIRLSVPKFDVSSQMELSGGLQALGLTDAFDASVSDFTPLTDVPLMLSEVRHDARVVIDEEGCEAAAYTVMMMAGAGAPVEMESIDFVLDRPFLFVITGADELPLFVGVVNQP